ncbi:hypothetical protein FWF48_00880 [Candidatus Saccharibacteria bacterium]|nr:hypothetical protein [Candidatus Saccharibacteria bacterium]
MTTFTEAAESIKNDLAFGLVSCAFMLVAIVIAMFYISLAQTKVFLILVCGILSILVMIAIIRSLVRSKDLARPLHHCTITRIWTREDAKTVLLIDFGNMRYETLTVSASSGQFEVDQPIDVLEDSGNIILLQENSILLVAKPSLDR